MEAIKAKIKANKNFKHFLAYSSSFLGYGCIITGLGPMIPYFSAATGRQQTDYNILFFSRSMGFITGALLLKILEKYLKFHQILIISSYVILLLSTIFSFITDLTYQTVCIFFISMFCCYLQIMVNVCILQVQKKYDQQFWMLLTHGVFGIGGLVGPILVYFFQLKSFLIMGIVVAIVTPSYFYLDSPQDHKVIQQQLLQEGALQQISKSGHQGGIINHPIQQKQKFIPKQIQIVVSFMFLVYIGLQASYGGWISSYAVLSNISTKQNATRFASIFWMSMTIFRFLSSCMPLTPSKKLYILLFGQIIFSAASLGFISLGYISYACNFSAITFGASLSSMFPLFLSIPAQYGLDISTKQNANFMVWTALGQGILSFVIGYLMKWIHINMLFIMLMIFVLIQTYCAYYSQSIYIKQSTLPEISKKNQTEMRNIGP